ncbi:MAG: hypothetical protein GXP25_25435 [Planctomycetes bacterium]|nr:hypothetical protein [Planctomycetota bacterium]
MANASPNDTYAVRLRKGQWLIIRPESADENQKGKDGEEKSRRAKVMWLQND